MRKKAQNVQDAKDRMGWALEKMKREKGEIFEVVYTKEPSNLIYYLIEEEYTRERKRLGLFGKPII